MCGIAAVAGGPDGLAEADVAWGRRAVTCLRHRGPDDRGEHEVAGAWLGHARLSIVDLDTGHQPLLADDGWAMVGNGEVYNHADLRPDLPAEDFRTRSDNEVVLHLVRTRGPQALAALRGMIGAVVAGPDGTVVAWRDPVGIKPLYWVRRDDGSRLFASEIRAFDVADLPLVEPFPPGHVWVRGPGQAEGELTMLVDPTPVADAEVLAGWDGVGDVPEHLLTEVRERLVGAIEREMLGDVPVGVLLSGGLDSSLVAAVAQRWCRERGTTLKTFCVGTPGSADLVAARVDAEFLVTEHHEAEHPGSDLLDALPEAVGIIESFDPALVRSAVPNLLLARLAGQHVKVVLTGEGADELFAGYAYLDALHDDPDALHAELVPDRAGSARPEPPARGPDVHGSVAGGPSSVPGPGGGGAGPGAAARRQVDARRGAAGEGPAAARLRRLAARGDPVAEEGAVRRRLRGGRGAVGRGRVVGDRRGPGRGGRRRRAAAADPRGAGLLPALARRAPRRACGGAAVADADDLRPPHDSVNGGCSPSNIGKWRTFSVAGSSPRRRAVAATT